MANNRYYLLCPVCDDTEYLGKSLGGGIYNMAAFAGRTFKPEELLTKDKAVYPSDLEQAAASGQMLEEIYEWMWKHLMECVGDEFTERKLFAVITEYDERFRRKPLKHKRVIDLRAADQESEKKS